MDTTSPSPSPTTVASRIGIATIAVLVIGAAGSRGLPLPATTDLYGRTVATVGDAPRWLGHGFEVVSDLGLLILAGALLLAAWRNRRRVIIGVHYPHDSVRAYSSLPPW